MLASVLICHSSCINTHLCTVHVCRSNITIHTGLYFVCWCYDLYTHTCCSEGFEWLIAQFEKEMLAITANNNNYQAQSAGTSSSTVNASHVNNNNGGSSSNSSGGSRRHQSSLTRNSSGNNYNHYANDDSRRHDDDDDVSQTLMTT
jgi:hypothetical protein